MIRSLALILGLQAGSAVAAAVPPKLDFSGAELALATGLMRYPDLASFYGANGLQPIFTGPEARPRRAALLAAIETAAEHGLPAWRYEPERVRASLDDDSPDLETEVVLARVFSLWVHDVSAGIVDPRRVSPAIKRAGEGVDTAALMASFATAADPGAVLARAEPRDPQYRALRRALADARVMAAPEGAPLAPEGLFRPGARDPLLRALRARLAAMGFDAASATDDPTLYDEGLRAAVAAFQQAAGLPSDGVAGPRTIQRLNAPPDAGPRDILMAMERWRWLPDDLDDGQDRHIWVNLPQFTAAIVTGGDTTFETKAVIGKTDDEMQTPEFSDRMEFVVANPRWNIPRSITVREYLPRLQKNPNAAGHLDVVNSAGKVVPRSSIDFGRYTEKTFPYRMRQKPGDDNALGLVKFLFPNPWNIYLHDTPSKGLFGQSRRAFSHGCVRIGDPQDLARALLSAQTDDPAATFAAALAGGKERYLTLKPSVPIHLVYFTTLPDASGRLRRYPDVYDRDAALWGALSRAMKRPDAAANLLAAD